MQNLFPFHPHCNIRAAHLPLTVNLFVQRWTDSFWISITRETSTAACAVSIIQLPAACERQRSQGRPKFLTLPLLGPPSESEKWLVCIRRTKGTKEETREKDISSGRELWGIDLPLWFKLTLSRPAGYIHAITDDLSRMTFCLFLPKMTKLKWRWTVALVGLTTPTLVQFTQWRLHFKVQNYGMNFSR